MIPLQPSVIESWHAHVYFDAGSRDAAWALRQTIMAELEGRMAMGRFHEKPVGPHPMWSYQLAFDGEHFAQVVAWLTLNHGVLDVFIHPNTGDELIDHRDRALWLGRSHTLNLSALDA
jgi:DOPA 4,5-dioxygenase